MSNEKNNAAPDPQPAELAEQQGDALAHAMEVLRVVTARAMQGSETRLAYETVRVALNCRQSVTQVVGHVSRDSSKAHMCVNLPEGSPLYALAATGKQQVGGGHFHHVRQVKDFFNLPLTAKQVGEEVGVEEDVYYDIAAMIEPYVKREGSNPDGPLPASVHDSVQIIFDHWLKTRTQVGEVQGDGLAALSASWRSCAEKHDENAREADSIGDMTATVQYLEAKSEVLRQVAAELEAALAARQPGAQVPTAWLIEWKNGVTALTKDASEAEAHREYKNCTVVPVYAAPPAQGIDLGLLQAVSDEYNEWIIFHAAGNGDFDDFLRQRSQRDAAPGVGNG